MNNYSTRTSGGSSRDNVIGATVTGNDRVCICYYFTMYTVQLYVTIILPFAIIVVLINKSVYLVLSDFRCLREQVDLNKRFPGLFE